MDLINRIKGIRKYYIDTITKEQQYVLEYETDERVTAFSCFRERQSGRSTAVCLKAIKLSDEGNKHILVCSNTYAGVEHNFETTFKLLKENKIKIAEIRKAKMDMFIRLSNGSHIKFIIATEANMRGRTVNYVLIDDADLQRNRFIIESVVMCTMNDKKGQAFYFLGGD